MEACLNTVGECRRCDADEVLATVAGVRSEPTQMQECEVFKWRRRYKRSSMETVISTRMSHKAKRNKAQPRIVIPECADAMRVSEHCTSTPCTRTQRLMINSLVSKCRTRQPESCDTLFAFLHDWLERGVWAEPPTDLRLNDGQCWLLVKALLLLSSGQSVTWSSGSVHMMTDAKRVENLVSLRGQEFDARMVDTCKIRDVPRRCGSRLVFRFERARGLTELLQGGTLHGRHTVSAQGAHAGGELVQSPGGYLHGPGSSPSYDEQVRFAD